MNSCPLAKLLFGDKFLEMNPADPSSKLLLTVTKGLWWGIRTPSLVALERWHFVQKSDKGLGQWFSLGLTLAPGDIWQCLETFLVGVLLVVMGRGQGCRSGFHNAQDSPQPKVPTELRLRNRVKNGLGETLIMDHRKPNGPSPVSRALLRLTQDEWVSLDK